MRTRNRIALKRVAVRQLGARFRMLPNTLIIGAQRSGTSSLYKYLGQHPEVAASLRKETRYFTEFLDRGERWYRAHFPLAPPLGGRRTRISFEATPDYLLDPRCAGRAAAALGECKIIALVRDPVERAFSHYKHNRRLGNEPLSFEEALDREESRLSPYRETMIRDPQTPTPREFCRFSYVTRGLYAEQLTNWVAAFGREQIHVIASEDVYRDPAAMFAELVRFLGITPWTPREFKNYSYVGRAVQDGRGKELAPETRARLERRFAEANARLCDLLGRRFDWCPRDGKGTG